jgi:hypothetical protein
VCTEAEQHALQVGLRRNIEAAADHQRGFLHHCGVASCPDAEHFSQESFPLPVTYYKSLPSHSQ